jgi:tetratricopeptide (TPR) repeat protein
MTPTLTHPLAEDLGRFVEGTLDDTARAAIVAHIADCDECRMVVVDAAEFVEPVVVRSERRWWVAAAAAIVMVAGSSFLWYESRDPLTPVRETSAHSHSRAIDGRLAGFSYVKRINNRSGGEEDNQDPVQLQLDAEAGSILESQRNNPKTLHAKGVVLLLLSRPTDPQNPQEARNQTIARLHEAVTLLQEAAKKDETPANLSDLAAALIATGDKESLERAIKVCDRALQIDARFTEALFNRAKALDLMNQRADAIAAYGRYRAVDSSSPWAREAEKRIEGLREFP